MWSAICFNLDQSKFLSSGNGLMIEFFVTENWGFMYISHVSIKEAFFSKGFHFKEIAEGF